MRTKEPESICRTLNQLSEISKCWNIRNVAQFDLFPKSEDLIATERKYSDALTGEDIQGIKVEVKKSKKGKKPAAALTTTTNNNISTMNDLSKSLESKVNLTLSSAASH